jgi:hypothetical protein
MPRTNGEVSPLELVSAMSISKKVAPEMRLQGKLKAHAAALHQRIEAMCQEEQNLEGTLNIFDLIDELKEDEGKFTLVLTKGSISVDGKKYGKEVRQAFTQFFIDHLMDEIKDTVAKYDDN